MRNRFSTAVFFLLALTLNAASSIGAFPETLEKFAREKNIASPREKLALLQTMYRIVGLGWHGDRAAAHAAAQAVAEIAELGTRVVSFETEVAAWSDARDAARYAAWAVLYQEPTADIVEFDAERMSQLLESTYTAFLRVLPNNVPLAFITKGAWRELQVKHFLCLNAESLVLVLPWLAELNGFANFRALHADGTSLVSRLPRDVMGEIRSYVGHPGIQADAGAAAAAAAATAAVPIAALPVARAGCVIQ